MQPVSVFAVEVPQIETLDQQVSELVRRGRDVEAVGMQAASCKDLFGREPAAAKMAVVGGAIGLNDCQRRSIKRAQKIGAPGEFMVDGLKQTGAGLASHIVDDARHALEILRLHHEIEIGIEMVRQAIVAGEDAVGLASRRKRFEESSGDARVRSDERLPAGFHYILGGQ